MKAKALPALALAIALLALPPLAAAARDEYDDSQSHPLRTLAYLLHPLGVLAEWTIYRPFHALVSATPTLEYIFGHKPHPPLFLEPQPPYDYGVPRREPVREPPKPRVSAAEPTAEKVVVKERLVEKTVVQEVPRIVEIEKVVFPAIAFNFGRADLTEYGKGLAYLAAQTLKEKSEIEIVIEGHADRIGSDEYNLRLGMRRAESVKKELERLGIAPERMSVASLGESKPLIDAETGWARAVNRRVEFRVSSSQAR